MHATVKDRQQAILEKFPPTAAHTRVILLTSPFQQAFMAFTSYFIDSDWNYREVLLGFEPLHETQSEANLSTVLLAKI